MKKIIALMLTLALAFSLAACGGSDAPASTATASTPAAAPAEGASPETVAAVDKYNAAIDRYNAAVDAIAADEALSALTEVTDIINQCSDMLNELAPLMDATESFTAEQIASIDAMIANMDVFTAELENLAATYVGKKMVTINATVVNQTEADFAALAMSPSGEASWGGNLLSEPLPAGASGTLTMTITEDSLVWDVLCADSEGTSVEFMGLDFSEVSVDAGATITLAATEGGYMAMVE